MTGRRPQDPHTKRLRDPEEDVPTLNPADPGATMMPEDVDPDATALGERVAKPASKGAVRGGAAATWTGDRDAPKVGAIPAPVAKNPRPEPAPAPPRPVYEPPPAEVVETQEVEPVTQPPRKPPAKPAKKKGSSAVVWIVAFLLLGGIGFGVAWLLMNPPAGEADNATAAAGAATPTSATATPAADAGEAADAADASPAADTADASPAADTADASAAAAADTVDASQAVDTADGAAPDAAEVAAPDTADTALAAAPTVADAAPDAGAGADPADAQAPATPDAAAPTAPVVSRDPAKAKRLNEQGFAARKAGDHPRALALYAEALTYNPDDVWARYNLACELSLAGQHKEALAELTTLYKLSTAESKKALAAARKDSDFDAISDTGQFKRLTR